MKQLFVTIAIALVLGFSSTAALLAGDESAAGKKPSISATQKVQLTTVVEAIDLETRLLTLKGPEGNTRTLSVSEETHNLEMVEVGDQVNVEYVQHMSIEVLANDGTQPGTGTMTAVAHNKEDQAPGGMEMETTVITATVEEINLEASTFKLKMPGGEIRDFEAVNPDNLRKAAVGDLVVTTYTEALAVYLAEVPAE